MFVRLFTTMVLATGLSFAVAREAGARGGNLEHPSIAIPTTRPDGPQDPTVKRVQEVLMQHKDHFVNGWFVNAHSVLNFAGDAKELSKLIGELSEVEGAAVSVRFSQESGMAQPVFAEEGATEKPCQWSIDHNGWGQAEHLWLTIYLGGGVIKLPDLDLPAIRGTKPAAKPEAELPEVPVGLDSLKKDPQP